MAIRLFSDDPKQRFYEREMQMHTGYQKLGGGIAVLRSSRYTAATANCKFCKEYGGKKIGSKAGICHCIDERTQAGCVSILELLNIFSITVHYPKLTERITRVKECSTPFRNEQHKKMWSFLCESGWLDLQSASKEYLSALFLLTSDSHIWNKTKTYISRTRVRLDLVKIGTNEASLRDAIDSYAIWRAAKEMIGACGKITLSELCDPELISEPTFLLIVYAFLIRRYGANILKIKEENSNVRI